MSRQPVTTDDLVAAGAAAYETLSQIAEPQWQEKPPRMDWTRHVIASHICGALQFYATQLAVGSDRYTPTIRLDEAGIKSYERPGLVKSQTTLLAAVARGAAPGTRAWHPSGLPDSEGFLAIGCTEVLLHCWDAVQGTDLEFEGDSEISDRILRRIFPWAPTETPRWQTLLFVTGRADLEGHESPGEQWMWHSNLLDEWDGAEPRSDMWVKR